MTRDEPIEEPRDTSYYDDDAYDESEHLKSCQNLWAAVVAQAVEDALDPDDGTTRPLPRGKNGARRRTDISAGVVARRWIAGGSDYHAVCRMGGVDHAIIRAEVAKKVMQRNIRAAEMDNET